MEGRSGREKRRGMKQNKKKSEVVWLRGEKVEASEVKDGVGLESLRPQKFKTPGSKYFEESIEGT